MTREDLIERLTKATGPDRGLDFEIECLGTPGHAPPMRFLLTLDSVPPFTASMDAALTRMQKGWHVSHAYWDSKRAHFTLHNLKVINRWFDGEATTPAVAFLIAALKASAPDQKGG